MLAGLGIAVLPLPAAQGLASALGLALLAPADDWAERRMLRVARSEPPPETPLALLAAHLDRSAARHQLNGAQLIRGIVRANPGRTRSASASARRRGVAGSQGWSPKRNCW